MWRVFMMNKTRKFASAALSFALLTGFAGNGMLSGISGNLSIIASAATVNSITSASAWNAAVAQEQQKYPEYKGGRKCYWNKGWNSNTNQYGNEDTYSTTRCYHNDMGYCNTCNICVCVNCCKGKGSSKISYNTRTFITAPGFKGIAVKVCSNFMNGSFRQFKRKF